MDEAVRGSLIILCSAIFVVMLGLGFIAPLLPIYAESLGASNLEIGLIFSSFAVVRALTMTPLGGLSDTFGRKSFIVLGMLFYSAATLLYVFATNVYQLILFRAFHGFASALVLPAAMAYVADLFPESGKGEAMGIFNMALFAGIGFGPLIGGVLAEKVSFYSPFYACSAIAFTGFLLSLFRLKESKKFNPQTRKIRFSYGFDLLKGKSISSVIFLRMTVATGISSVIAFLPLLAYNLGIGIMRVGFLLTIQHIALIFSQAKFSVISDRYGRKRPIILGSLLATVSLALLGFSRSFLAFLISLIVFGFSTGLTIPAASAAVADVADKEKLGEAMGLLTTAISIGMALGPIVGGLISEFFGLISVFYAAAIISLLGAFVFKLGYPTDYPKSA